MKNISQSRWSHSLARFERPADNRKVMSSNLIGTTTFIFRRGRYFPESNGAKAISFNGSSQIMSNHRRNPLLIRLPDLFGALVSVKITSYHYGADSAGDKIKGPLCVRLLGDEQDGYRIFL